MLHSDGSCLVSPGINASRRSGIGRVGAPSYLDPIMRPRRGKRRKISGSDSGEKLPYRPVATCRGGFWPHVSGRGALCGGATGQRWSWGKSDVLTSSARARRQGERTNATIFLYDWHLMDDMPVLRHVGPTARGLARRRAIRLALGDVPRGSGRAGHALMLSPGGRMGGAL